MDLTLTDWLENSGSWRSACTTMAFWLYCYYEMLELITKPQHLLVEKRGRHPEVEWCSFFEVQTLAELEAALCLVIGIKGWCILSHYTIVCMKLMEGPRSHLRRCIKETFGAQAMPVRLFLRALSHVGLGHYYQLRNKPRAAVRFLEQAWQSDTGSSDQASQE